MISITSRRFVTVRSACAGCFLAALLAFPTAAYPSEKIRIDASCAEYEFAIRETAPPLPQQIYPDYRQCFLDAHRAGYTVTVGAGMINHKFARMFRRVRTGVRHAIEKKLYTDETMGKDDFVDELFKYARYRFMTLDVGERDKYARAAAERAFCFMSGLALLRGTELKPGEYTGRTPLPPVYAKNFAADRYSALPSGAWDENTLTRRAWIDWRYLMQPFRLTDEDETAAALSLALVIAANPELELHYRVIRKAMDILEGRAACPDALTYYEAYRELVPTLDLTRENVRLFRQDLYRTRAGAAWREKAPPGASLLRMAIFPDPLDTKFRAFNSPQRGPAPDAALVAAFGRNFAAVSPDESPDENLYAVFGFAARSREHGKVVDGRLNALRRSGRLPTLTVGDAPSPARQPASGVIIRPSFSFEADPDALVYWGDLFDDLERRIKTAFDGETLGYIHPETGDVVEDATTVIHVCREGKRLAFGLAALAAEKLGDPLPRRMRVFSPDIVRELRNVAAHWIEKILADADLAADVRDLEIMGPATADGAYDLRAVLGVRPVTLEIKFRRFPQIEVGDDSVVSFRETAETVVSEPLIYEFRLTNPPKVLNTYVLRRIIAHHKTPENIIAALHDPANYPPPRTPEKTLIEKIVDSEIQDALWGKLKPPDND